MTANVAASLPLRRACLPLSALLLAPAAAVILFFGLALLAMFRASLEQPGASLAAYSTSGLTFANYVKIATDPLYLGYFLTTLRVSFSTVVVTLALGLPVAAWISWTPRRAVRTLLMTLVTVPFLTSIVVRLYALTLVLANTGLVNELLRRLGILASHAFIPLMRNELGVTIGTTAFVMPFAIFMLIGTFRRTDATLAEAARVLGADEIAVFFRITLPLIWSGVLGACLMAFILASIAFTSPLMLGGGSADMIANAVYNQSVVLLNREIGAALAVVTLAMTLVVIYPVRYLERHDHAG